MKKALVSKSANLTSCSDKFVNPSSRVTVRLQPPLEPSNPSIKTRLTYGMEDTHAQSTSSTTTAAPKEDIYEFKSSSKEATPVRSSQSPEPKHEAENKVTEDKPDKRPLDEGLEEDPKRKKQKKDELSKGRGSRGSSMEKGPICPKTAKTRVSNNEQQSQAMSGSPKKPESDSDDDNSKKSTDSSGLKVPPLKIVLSAGNNSGNATPPSSGVENNSRNETPTISNSINQNPSTSGIENNSKKLSASLGRYVNKEDNNSFSNNEEGRSEEANDGDSGGTNEKGGRMTRSKAHQGTPGPDGFGDSQGASSSSDQTATDSSDNRDHKNPSSDYSFKKRKLRSQVEDNVNSNSSSIFTRGGNGGNNGSSNGNGCSNLNGNNSNGGNPNGNLGCGGNGNNSAIEPMNDIEKYLHIRKQIEQRRKNLFPVQPKPPQGFKDYLMNRKSYLLQENASERLRQIPLIQPPPSLEGAMVELFKEQEEARRKLRMKHVVEKEKLVLSVEQEILRVHGRAARALANQSLPYSLCTILRDEEIYTPIDPQQEEKNRDIRSRYNGRLFLSWLQDVDDKWERIKEQMVLRHHNEAESLNAVQKMDWEWKLKEISDNPSSFNDSIKPQIDDLLIPMVHVSDEFDLTDCRN
uniref:Ankyrin repeat domain-containing protein 12 n=2 Tax=Lepeophtheirus salmonis TaxID=72036 RepID=A0A0K2TPQ5_LEPSM